LVKSGWGDWSAAEADENPAVIPKTASKVCRDLLGGPE